jgi:methylmalonyl-CoA mutase cobalamin-binding domain/chain
MADDAAARLYQAFVSQDPAQAIAIIQNARARGIEQSLLFDQMFAPAMSLLGGAWASGAIDEYAFTKAAVVAEQVTSFVTPPATAADTGVTVLVGTMHKDVHTADKNIIAAALTESGHRVIDLGVDVLPSEFLERVEETGAQFIIVFAQTASAAASVARVREMLAGNGRGDVVVFVSGGPFAADAARARAVGANGVVRGAESAMKLIAKVSRDRSKS